MMMKHWVNLIISLFLIACMGATRAEPETDTAEPAQQSVEKDQQQPVQKSPAGRKPLKEFIPSEELSIDKPVAFPVDI